MILLKIVTKMKNYNQIKVEVISLSKLKIFIFKIIFQIKKFKRQVTNSKDLKEFKKNQIIKNSQITCQLIFLNKDFLQTKPQEMKMKLRLYLIFLRMEMNLFFILEHTFEILKNFLNFSSKIKIVLCLKGFFGISHLITPKPTKKEYC